MLWGALLVVALAAPATCGEARARKPRLDLRVTPRMAFSPVEVLVLAELVGGDQVEEFYCPALEWEWGDGSRSVHEADCAPFETGMEMERRFTARHAYREPGDYSVKLRLRRADRSLAVATTRILVYGRSAGFDGY